MRLMPSGAGQIATGRASGFHVCGGVAFETGTSTPASGFVVVAVGLGVVAASTFRGSGFEGVVVGSVGTASIVRGSGLVGVVVCLIGAASFTRVSGFATTRGSGFAALGSA